MINNISRILQNHNRLVAIFICVAICLGVFVTSGDIKPILLLLALMLASVVFFVLFLSPQIVILLLIISYPFTDIWDLNYAGVYIRLSNLFTVVLVISLFFSFIEKREILRPTNILVSWLFLGSLALSLLVSEYLMWSVRYVILELLGILLLWCITIYTTTSDKFFSVLRVSLWVANLLAVAEIIELILKIVGLPGFFPVHHDFMLSVGRISGLFREPDRAGQYHLVFALWTLAFILAPSSLKTYSGLVGDRLIKFTFWLNLSILLLGGFRAALTGIVIGIGLCLFLYRMYGIRCF